MDNATPQQPCLNLHAYEEAARATLPSAVYEFIAGGSGDEVTVRACRAAFGRWHLLPRVLRGHRDTSTATSVLGQDVSLPVLVAPWAAHKLCHIQGERAARHRLQACLVPRILLSSRTRVATRAHRSPPRGTPHHLRGEGDGAVENAFGHCCRGSIQGHRLGDSDRPEAR